MNNYRPTWVEIAPKAAVRNISALRKKIPQRCKLIAVVKADAYGHGADLITQSIKNYVWGFGVATIEEGIGLREDGIKNNIIVLGSLWPFKSFLSAHEYNLIPTVSSIDGIKALTEVAHKKKKKLEFYLEIDTGMGRIGVQFARSTEILKLISTNNNINCRGIYSHFSSADFDIKYSKEQLKRFLNVKAAAEKLAIKTDYSIANSAGLLNLPQSHLDAVRPGISIYGLKPFAESEKKITLSPVLSWKTRVVFVKKVPKGSPISYMGTFIAKRNSIIATLPVGYADGYRVALSNNSRVILNGAFAPIVGRVTMDMIMVDITGIGRVSVGDEAVLIGRQKDKFITAEELADRSSTINYEITCGISARVPRLKV